MLGFAHWREVSGKIELLQLQVRGDRQRRGCGKALVRSVLAQGVPTSLFVVAGNPGAISLYTSCGFRVCEDSREGDELNMWLLMTAGKSP